MNTRPTEERIVDFSGRTLGPYRLRQRVGDGGYSTVYRAEDARNGTIVAVKILDPRANRTDIDRFRREIELTRNLYEQDGNRHVLRVFESGEDDGLRWYAMEFLKGHNLRDILHTVSGEGLRWEVAAFILQNVCYAVAKMHDREVIHRDLKPDNIILERTPTGQIWVKIIDLGIAKEISIESKIGEVKFPTGRNEIPGTGPYIAPERFGLGLCTPATDQYSLGVLLYECLHGKLPFPETDNIGTIAVQAHGSRDGIPWNPVPRAIRDIVLRAMATDSRYRFPSVLAMGQALHLSLRDAAEYVDGQATTLKQLDQLDQRRRAVGPLRSASRGASSADEVTQKVLADRLAAEKALQEAEQLAEERRAAARRAAEEKLAEERKLDAIRATRAEQATTHEIEAERRFLARHGRRIQSFMKRSMLVAAMTIVGMTECAADTRWVRVQDWWKRSQERAPSPTLDAKEVAAAPRPEPARPAKTETETETKVLVEKNASREAVPVVPEQKPDNSRPLGKVVASSPVVRQPTSPNSPPKASDDDLLPMASSPVVRQPTSPNSPPKASDDDLLPVGAKSSTPASRAQNQLRKLVQELCTFDASPAEATVQVCVDLVLDGRGVPTPDSGIGSVSPESLTEDTRKCVLRIAKAHVRLPDVASKSVTACFKLRGKR